MSSSIFLYGMLGVIVIILIMLHTKTEKEGLAYLKQYDGQDMFQNNPNVWPVLNNEATIRFAVERNQKFFGK
jgi:hypothetical protein